jgi:hypothetical protein
MSDAPPVDPGEGLSPIDFDQVGPPLGSRFPDVTLPSQHGTHVDLHAYRAGRPALVVFHRSADW